MRMNILILVTAERQNTGVHHYLLVNKKSDQKSRFKKV